MCDRAPFSPWKRISQIEICFRFDAISKRGLQGTCPNSKHSILAVEKRLNRIASCCENIWLAMSLQTSLFSEMFKKNHMFPVLCFSSSGPEKASCEQGGTYAIGTYVRNARGRRPVLLSSAKNFVTLFINHSLFSWGFHAEYPSRCKKAAVKPIRDCIASNRRNQYRSRL